MRLTTYPVQSACPLCGDSKAVLAAGRSRSGEPLHVVSCLQCGLFRNDPLPSSRELAEFHAVEYRDTYKGRREPKRRNVYRSARMALHRLHDIERYLPPGCRVLDVGAGSGEWLYALRLAGYQPSGVEADPAYGAFGRQQYGVAIETKPILEVGMQAESLDAITIFHVLEHLPDPVAALERFAAWLKPQGVLIIEVPNTNCRNQHPGQRFHQAHVIGFTRESLQYLCQRLGWELIDLSTSAEERNLLAVLRKPDGVMRAAPPVARHPVPPPRVTSLATTAAYYLQPGTYRRWTARMLRFAAEYAAVRSGRDGKTYLREALAARRSVGELD